MGQVKQSTIDDVSVRVYMINDEKVTRYTFISQVLINMYEKTTILNFREKLNSLLNDDNAEELLCIDGKKYFTYLELDSSMNNIINKLKEPRYDGDELLRGNLITEAMEKGEFNIVQRLREEGLSNKEIANRLGLSEGTIVRLLPRKEPLVIVNKPESSDWSELKVKPIHLKEYLVYYDVTIKPTIQLLNRKTQWKRTSETIVAGSFREAKDILRSKYLNNPDKKRIKNIQVMMLKEVEHPKADGIEN